MPTPIPQGPWTEESLGTELYTTLAIEHGVFDPRTDRTFRPALDLTAAYNEQQGQAKAKPKATEKE